MRKMLRVDDKLVVLFEDGTYYECSNIEEDLFKKVETAKTDEEAFALMCPDRAQIKTYENAKEIIEKLKSLEGSKLLVLKGECVYWEEVSQLSMPPELVKSVLDAEKNNDKTRIETYKNFWTLMSLNPDERCRKNLFWFLNKNGLVIAKCGFFVAYRNADFLRKEEDGTIVYTDSYTHTMSIKIGEMVTMPREKCDPVQENTCSRGLHLGASWWLEKGYYGKQGLVCLCNPADVVAVPPLDDYGKLRTCAYLPIQKAEFNENGKVIPINAKDGFDCSYVTKVIYEGLMGTEEDTQYEIKIPEIPGLNKESISNRLLDLALKCITDREVQ